MATHLPQLELFADKKKIILKTCHGILFYFFCKYQWRVPGFGGRYMWAMFKERWWWWSSSYETSYKQINIHTYNYHYIYYVLCHIFRRSDTWKSILIPVLIRNAVPIPFRQTASLPAFPEMFWLRRCDWQTETFCTWDILTGSQLEEGTKTWEQRCYQHSQLHLTSPGHVDVCWRCQEPFV